MPMIGMSRVCGLFLRRRQAIAVLACVEENFGPRGLTAYKRFQAQLNDILHERAKGDLTKLVK